MKTRLALATPSTRTRIAQLVMVVLGSLLMAIGAHVAVPLPFSPVPVTGQTFTLALVVAMLGTRGATLSLAIYVAEGFTGWRVFSPVGLLGPSLGYIVAFPAAGFVTGWLFDRGFFASYAGRAAAILIGTAVVFAGGASYLATLVGWHAALTVGVVPFLIGDAVKTLAAAAVAPFVRDAGKIAPRS